MPLTLPAASRLNSLRRSSRFGKFLKLYFDKSAKIQGAALSTYLLEKSRVTHIGQGERAYHIFYNLLRGLPADKLKQLRLPSANVADYKCAPASSSASSSALSSACTHARAART